jgi:hypothetical protein
MISSTSNKRGLVSTPTGRGSRQRRGIAGRVFGTGVFEMSALIVVMFLLASKKRKS